MRPIPFRDLLLRCLSEYRAKGSIFDIPVEHFWKPRASQSARVFSSAAANPIGPAAGPHTQLAQNIIVAWLTGGRYFELKTVQKLDALVIDKPCIDAADEGYNVEWSTELSLDGAYEEYLKAWVALHFFEALLGQAAGSFLFNMSVGYDLAGIKTEKMDRLINRLMDSSGDPLFDRCREELAGLASDGGFLRGTPWESNRSAIGECSSRIQPRMCMSVTLSTMHGCPPDEIESICTYMLKEKKLDTLVKLNPTLLGHERVSEILSGLGYGYIRLKPEGFLKDLQHKDALPMLTRLMAIGRAEGRHFGAKLSNTLAAVNDRQALPGAEMYMSGRALYPLTITLADALASEFEGSLPLSFSGGAAWWNLAAILEAGIRPVTVATELLKPGGYGRMKELAQIAASHSDSWQLPTVDVQKTHRAAMDSRAAHEVRKEYRGTGKVAVAGPLPILDCFVAPCVEACPIHQDVPEYVHLTGSGRMSEALEVVFLRNPLPFMTGYLCDHQCMENCTRKDWEGAVQIREMKKIAAERGYEAFLAAGGRALRTAPSRGAKVAVLGAGPAGLAAAAFLCREGFEVHLFEREREPGGIVRYLLPGFRIPAGAVEKDVALLRALGAVLHFDQKARTIHELRAEGFHNVLIGVGAEAHRDAGIRGARDALSFLRAYRRDASQLWLGKTVAVIGAGDTAMDAARAALKCPGVEEVRIVYRREERQMPASREEYLSAREEGVRFHFLRAPESWAVDAGLRCRVMKLGDADSSGRPRPVATAETELLPATSVIAALGAEVDAAALGALGLPEGMAIADPKTQETGVPGVFLIGDAAEGAATIVRAIASARRAAEAIAQREGGALFRGWALPPENAAALRLMRDGLNPTAVRAEEAVACATESRRCLGCKALCIKCVEVCPNRANTLVKASGGFRDKFQIVHLDALCNECGNCATFCPWEGKPYKDKLTVFDAEEDFKDSTNPGFFLCGREGLIRFGGRLGRLHVDEAHSLTSDLGDVGALAVVQAILKDLQYLLGGLQPGGAK
jgi:putative selenate reductase